MCISAEGVDFSLTVTSLTFDEALTSITVPVTIAMDDRVEFSEGFQLRITLDDPSLADRVALDPDTADVTIFDSDSKSSVLSQFGGIIKYLVIIR